MTGRVTTIGLAAALEGAASPAEAIAIAGPVEVLRLRAEALRQAVIS